MLRPHLLPPRALLAGASINVCLVNFPTFFFSSRQVAFEGSCLIAGSGLWCNAHGFWRTLLSVRPFHHVSFSGFSPFPPPSSVFSRNFPLHLLPVGHDFPVTAFFFFETPQSIGFLPPNSPFPVPIPPVYPSERSDDPPVRATRFFYAAFYCFFYVFLRSLSYSSVLISPFRDRTRSSRLSSLEFDCSTPGFWSSLSLKLVLYSRD